MGFERHGSPYGRGHIAAEEGRDLVFSRFHDFSRLIYKGRKLFEKYGEELTRSCTDDEFMALFEQYPDFDELDDTFIENEEAITTFIAHYVDDHLERFVTVE